MWRQGFYTLTVGGDGKFKVNRESVQIFLMLAKVLLERCTYLVSCKILFNLWKNVGRRGDSIKDLEILSFKVGNSQFQGRTSWVSYYSHQNGCILALLFHFSHPEVPGLFLTYLCMIRLRFFECLFYATFWSFAF